MTKEEKQLLLEYDASILDAYLSYPVVIGQLYARDLVNELFTLVKDNDEDVDFDSFHRDIKEIKEEFPLPDVIAKSEESKKAYYDYLDEYMLGLHDLDLESNYLRLNEGTL